MLEEKHRIIDSGHTSRPLGKIAVNVAASPTCLRNGVVADFSHLVRHRSAIETMEQVQQEAGSDRVL